MTWGLRVGAKQLERPLETPKFAAISIIGIPNFVDLARSERVGMFAPLAIQLLCGRLSLPEITKLCVQLFDFALTFA